MPEVKMTIDTDSHNFWVPLPGSYGEYFSIHGKDVAGVQANRISVWRNGVSGFEGSTLWECGSYPLWMGSKIFWNNNIVDIEAENPGCVDILSQGFFENTGQNAGYHPVTFAWSRDASSFLVSMEGYDRSGIFNSKVMLLDKESALISILWEGNDFAPKAAIISGEYIILGTRNTSIFDLKGNLLTRLPGDMIPQRIHVSETGEILLIQTHESITLWRTGAWTQTGLIKGPWLNAALSPDGQVIYAIDFRGTLYGAIVSDSSCTMKIIKSSAPIATIDAGDEYLVASFAQGDPVRWTLKRDIDSIIKN